MDTRKIAKNIRLEHWSQVITACQASGLNNKEYCEAKGINEKQFYYWQRQLREAACREMAVCNEQQEIVEVKLPTENEYIEDITEPTGVAKITIRINGAEIQITGDTRPELAESIIRALK